MSNKRNNFLHHKVKREIRTLIKQENFIDRQFTRVHLISITQIIQKKTQTQQRLDFSSLSFHMLHEIIVATTRTM